MCDYLNCKAPTAGASSSTPSRACACAAPRAGAISTSIRAAARASLRLQGPAGCVQLQFVPLMAVAVSVEPFRIGMTVLMLNRPQPMLQLLAFLCAQSGQDISLPEPLLQT